MRCCLKSTSASPWLRLRGLSVAKFLYDASSEVTATVRQGSTETLRYPTYRQPAISKNVGEPIFAQNIHPAPSRKSSDRDRDVIHSRHDAKFPIIVLWQIKTFVHPSQYSNVKRIVMKHKSSRQIGGLRVVKFARLQVVGIFIKT